MRNIDQEESLLELDSEFAAVPDTVTASVGILQF